MKRVLVTVGIVALSAIVATGAFAQGNNGVGQRGATFTPLGLFPMCDEVPEGEFCENFPITTAVDMTGDGGQVVGMHAFFSGAYLWTAADGLNTLGETGGAPWIAQNTGVIAYSPAYDYNGTFVGWGSVWTGGFYPNQTFDPLTPADDFALCGGSAQSAFNINSMGDIVVGLTWIDPEGSGNGCGGASAFTSDVGGGTSVLSNAINDDSTRANAVNADGSVVVGWMQTNQREATKWVDGVQEFLCPSPIGAGGENFCTEGWDVTPDGSVMLTSMATPEDFNTRATLVRQNGDYFQIPFPATPGDPQWDTMSMWALTPDANTVVGEFGGGGFFGSPPYPVVWVDGIGTIDLQIMLLGQGLDDLFFWFLSDATAVSTDGTIIAGSGTNPDGWIEAYQVDVSRIKVCHKPGEGNERTISIGWGGVADHLNHGDILATCEFAASDAAARFATRRQQASDAMGPADDGRIRSLDAWKRIQGATGGQQPGADAPTSFDVPKTGSADQTEKFGTPEQRRKSLYNRLDKRVDRR